MTTIWQNATLAPMRDNAPELLIERGALVVEGSSLSWAGPSAELPAAFAQSAVDEIDLGGALVTPGLIDCHSHLVYGGNRARDFERRLQGIDYAQIAREGGGIRSTVAATRQCGEDELYRQAAQRVQALAGAGVTTVEIKSGYGLTLADEARLLRVARRLGRGHGMEVRTTFLGAHAIAPGFEGGADAYIDAVCSWLPALQAEGLVDAVDAFCDEVGFTAAQCRRVLQAARERGLAVKLHAEQLGNQHGASMAAGLGALSCDHLEYLDEQGVQAMAAAGTVAVLLPGAYYCLGQTRPPPVAALRARSVPMALATDHNPGSSPTLSPLLMCNMACQLFRLTPWEALRGFTAHAARALGLAHARGSLAAGMRADFVVWDAEHPRELCYALGANLCRRRIQGGVEDGAQAAAQELS
jgi:imidazolonepropionase